MGLLPGPQQLACVSARHVDESGLQTESGLPHSLHHMTRGRKAANQVTSKSCTHSDRSVPVHVESKQRQFRLFQTVNHAKVIWDSKTKPKGIVGGHLNIRLTETWLNCNIPTHIIDVPGYLCFRKDRLIGRGGGVLIYIRDTFNCAKINLDMSLECVAINVMLSTKMKFNIVTLYNPPSNGASFYQDLDELLKQLNCSCETIFLGDYNINWLDKGSRQKLKTIYSKHNFQQIITAPTRLTKVSKTLIDLIFTNRPE